MEKTIEISVEASAKRLIRDGIKDVNYGDLSCLVKQCSDELKARDRAYGNSTGNCRSGNYPQK